MKAKNILKLSKIIFRKRESLTPVNIISPLIHHRKKIFETWEEHLFFRSNTGDLRSMGIL